MYICQFLIKFGHNNIGPFFRKPFAVPIIFFVVFDNSDLSAFCLKNCVFVMLNYDYLQESLSQPQMHIVTDVHEMFMPLVDGFLCDVNLSSNLIDQLMLEIPKMFCNTQETETVLLPAIEAGLEAVKVSFLQGKVPR